MNEQDNKQSDEAQTQGDNEAANRQEDVTPEEEKEREETERTGDGTGARAGAYT